MNRTQNLKKKSNFTRLIKFLVRSVRWIFRQFKSIAKTLVGFCVILLFYLQKIIHSKSIDSKAKPLRVGLISIGNGLGDNIFMLKALYALKEIYKCEVIAFGSGGAKNLFYNIAFIDEVVDVGNLKWGLLNRNNIGIIDKYHCDYIICAIVENDNIALLKTSTARHIITPLCFSALYNKKFSNIVSLSFFNYFSIEFKEKLIRLFGLTKNICVGEVMCALSREINPKIYDSKISSLDFNKIRIPTSDKNKTTILNFLNKIIKDSNLSITPPHFVLINPFCVSGAYNISLESWIRLAIEISKIPNVFIIIPTYRAVHEKFMQRLNEVDFDISNFAIFQNDDDLLNLVELVSKMSCVISPSTGTIHIASNLSIPSIGLFSILDSTRWATRDKRYVYLYKRTGKMNVKDEARVIKESIAMLREQLET